LDRVLEASTTKDDPLAGLVDPDRLGAGGLSLGGATTYGLAWNDCCKDERFKAVEVLCGATIPLPDPYDLKSRSLPLLIMHADKDGSRPYSGAVDTYALAIPPKYFVTLVGAPHAVPWEDHDTPWRKMVDTTTVDFWDAYLAGDRSRLPQ